MSDDAYGASALEPMDYDAFEENLWPDSADGADPTGANIFTAEIENVNSADWEVDPEVIWGDDPAAASGIDGGALGPDLLV